MSKRSAIIIIILVLVLGTLALYFILGGKGGSIGIPNFPGSPFGTPPDSTSIPGTTPGETPGETPIGTDGKPFPKFLKLSEAPVAGAVGFIKDGSTHVRYVERATGHVYDVNPGTLVKTRVTNTTQPKVMAAIFRPDAAGYVTRVIAEGSDTVANTSITLVAPRATSTDNLYTQQSTLLRGDIGDIAVSPNGNIIYNLKDSGAVSTATFTGGSQKTLLTMPFAEWRILPIDNASALIFTKAAASAPGYSYRLNTSTGALTKLLGPLNGLTVLPNIDASRLAYFHVSSNKQAFSIRNTSNGTSFDIQPTTLPEKCVWSKKTSSLIICGAPESNLGPDAPDNWYQGVARYSDRVWRFNVDTGTAELLLEPEENFDTEIDLIDPMLSPDEDYLFFTDKNTLSLWALKL